VPEAATRFTTFKDTQPSRDDDREQIRSQVDQVMAKDPTSVVLFAEYGNGAVITAAVGSPLGLNELVKHGLAQLADMLRRGRESGENG
jgi:hypothetical protein